MDKLKVIIMAGGQGIRLKPLTSFIPKPLISICGTPVMEILIKQLAAQGFKDITICLYHFASLIKSYFGDGSRWGVQIDYVIEPEPMGTIGSLTLIKKDLPENFIVVNGDIITDLDFYRFLLQHNNESILTIGAHEIEIPINYGVLNVDNNRVIGIDEKPIEERLINMGIYVFNRKFNNFVAPQKWNLDHLIITLLNQGQYINWAPHSGAWFDIGTPEDLEAAEKWYGENNPKNNKNSTNGGQ